jgi:hypothetical protein
MKMLSYIPEKLEMRTIAAKHGGEAFSPLAPSRSQLDRVPR